MTIQIWLPYAKDNIYAESLKVTGEPLEGEPTGDSPPTGERLIRLTSYAGAIPLVPGDVVTVENGAVTGIHELRKVWVLQIVTRTPDLDYVEGYDPSNWDAAELTTDGLREQLHRYADSHRDSTYGITVVTESREWFDRVVLKHPAVAQVWAFREPREELDLAHEQKYLGTDRIDQDGLMQPQGE